MPVLGPLASWLPAMWTRPSANWRSSVAVWAQAILVQGGAGSLGPACLGEITASRLRWQAPEHSCSEVDGPEACCRKDREPVLDVQLRRLDVGAQECVQQMRKAPVEVCSATDRFAAAQCAQPPLQAPSSWASAALAEGDSASRPAPGDGWRVQPRGKRAQREARSQSGAARAAPHTGCVSPSHPAGVRLGMGWSHGFQRLRLRARRSAHDRSH